MQDRGFVNLNLYQLALDQKDNVAVGRI